MKLTRIKRTTIRSTNPATGELNMKLKTMSGKQLNEILDTAVEAYESWKKTSIKKRAELLKKVAKLFADNKNELARLCAIEMGKRTEEGEAEVDVCINILDYYAKNGAEFLSDKPIPSKRGEAFITYEPIGVILSVQPWNFPFYQVIRNVAPNVMCGNTVVLKHAEIVPRCAQKIEDIFTRAGAPKGVFTNIYLHGPETSMLANDDRIKGVMFTGSESSGASLAKVAGKNVKKVLLELGGSDPFIILDDADLEKAVETAAMGRLTNAGQVCTSPKRIIVMESVVEEFIAKAKALYENVKVGDPQNKDVKLGPLSSEEQMFTVLEQIEDSVEEGATLVCGGKRIDKDGYFIEPTILTDIKKDTVAYSEEIFGPVLCVFPVKNEMEAIRLANDNKHGLGGTVFTNNTDRAVKIARQIEAGMICINEVIDSSAELPFGGTKKSGFGRELSPMGIYEFVNVKLIHMPQKENTDKKENK